MDALRNSKKISLLAVAILFLFTFFTLILDAPRTNGNIGNGYRVLLESGFKVGENSPMPKKIGQQNFYKK
jgi:hypothetical protein